MDIRTRYDIGCHLYMVRDDGREAKIDVVVITDIALKNIKGTKYDVYYRCAYGKYGLSALAKMDIEEKDINRNGAVYDNREQAYQAACKLIDSDIEYQLHVIRKGEKV